MTRENRNLLISAILILLVSSLVVFSYSKLLPTTGVDKMFNTKVKLENKDYFRLPPKILKVEDVYKGDKHLGVLYTVEDENNYGPITLRVAIDDLGIILGIDQVLEQNYPESHHSLLVHEYVKSLVGSKISNPQNLDGVTRPTTSITLGTIYDILDVIAVHAHFKEPDLPSLDPVEIYEILTDELVSLEEINVDDDIIEEKYEGFNSNNESIGYFYMAKKDNNFGYLRIIAHIDLDGNIVKLYSYDINQSLNLDQIEDFINNYNNFSDELDGFTGVTFAKEAFSDILDAIKNSHEDTSNPVSTYKVLSDELESLDEINISSDIIEKMYEGFNSENESIGYFYMAKKDNNFGYLKILVYVDLDGNLIKIDPYDINQSAHLLDQVIEFINNYNNFGDEVDGSTGVTFAKDAFIEILDEIELSLNNGGRG